MIADEGVDLGLGGGEGFGDLVDGEELRTSVVTGVVRRQPVTAGSTDLGANRTAVSADVRSSVCPAKNSFISNVVG